MKKFWEKEWFGIQFSDFTEISSTEIADSEFYEGFYARFFKKYKSFEELPESWRATKEVTAGQLFKLLQGKKRILSIGCGIGYIEFLLSKMFEGKGKLIALEPSVNATRWIDESVPNIELVSGFFPQAVEGEEFDAAYACLIDYCFDNQQYLNFLKSIKDFGIKEFTLTVNTLSYNWKGKIYNATRDLAEWVLCTMGLRRKPDRGQFWGYFRTVDEHIHILRKAGFTKFDSGVLPHGEEWIKCLV